MNIAILGIGRMGGAIAERLLDQGHTVTVWNRTPAKADKLVARGAKLASTPAQAVAPSDVVLSVLTDAKAIEQTYAGAGGVLSGNIQGKLFIDMSTVRPLTQIELAARLKAAHAAFVECPVGGTMGPARDGKLLGLAGGSAPDFARAKPVLEQLCRRLEHVGDVGAGASLKLAINLPLLVYWQALGEALALAAPSGLSPERLMDILADTSGAPAILKLRAPAIVSALQGKEMGPAHFNIDSIRKDLRTMVEEAQTLGYTLPTAQAALSSFNQAAADGLGQGDGTQLAAWWLSHAKQK
jgi:3-hydroxyisobutyrate dehydrogenase